MRLQRLRGTDGLNIFRDGAGWDVVLLDQKTPGVDGLETLSRTKAHDAVARVKVVRAFAIIELTARWNS
jgi:CheY-like chemotaxis protein